jgi:hypothetical protein
MPVPRAVERVACQKAESSIFFTIHTIQRLRTFSLSLVLSSNVKFWIMNTFS